MPIPRVPPKTAHALLRIVDSGDMTMEASMRLLFPEEAAGIYNLGRWPWGPPKEESNEQRIRTMQS